VISGFRHVVDDNWDLVAYYATSSGGFFSTFALKMGPICCPETSVGNYHNLLLNNPEELSYSTPKFIAVLTTARYLFLYSAHVLPIRAEDAF